uniref:RxLR effector candidate protein n=1 Tax=Hyaloperonospora arabidopsidis (strain Emoy2) TaxID=559515 RepID=M4BAL0_HYAAE
MAVELAWLPLSLVMQAALSDKHVRMFYATFAACKLQRRSGIIFAVAVTWPPRRCFFGVCGRCRPLCVSRAHPLSVLWSGDA